jgi:hypothetical protein
MDPTMVLRENIEGAQSLILTLAKKPASNEWNVLTSAGLLNLKFLFNPEIRPISSAVNLNEVHSKFWGKRSL